MSDKLLAAANELIGEMDCNNISLDNADSLRAAIAEVEEKQEKCKHGADGCLDIYQTPFCHDCGKELAK